MIRPATVIVLGPISHGILNINNLILINHNTSHIMVVRNNNTTMYLEINRTIPRKTRYQKRGFNSHDARTIPPSTPLESL